MLISDSEMETTEAEYTGLFEGAGLGKLALFTSLGTLYIHKQSSNYYNKVVLLRTSDVILKMTLADNFHHRRKNTLM